MRSLTSWFLHGGTFGSALQFMIHPGELTGYRKGHMGKYSLENYEIYKANKIRPVLSQAAPDNYGRGQITYISSSWAELETKKGCYTLNNLFKQLISTRNPILIIKPDLPEWVIKSPEECFSKLIRRIGSYCRNTDYLMGIVISTINNSIAEWNAYIEGFQNLPLFAELYNYGLIRYLKEQRQEFGLLINYDEKKWIDCSEAIALQKLQTNWERNPTLLHCGEEEYGEQLLKQATQWHAGYTNLKLNVGYNIALRRMTYPVEVSNKGALPLRFWFVNKGSAPCYNNISIKLLLTAGEEKHLLTLKGTPSNWTVGDIVHNEILKLPELEAGEYTLSVGLFINGHIPVFMGIQEDIAEGFYKMGELRVDTLERDNYKNIWEHYYPEGYYPLEDPQTPEATE